MHRIGLLLLVTACGSLVGCDLYDRTNGQDNSNPARLDEVEIPLDFDFNTTRQVSLQVEVSESLLERDEPIVVEVRRPTGVLVFQGTIDPGSESAIKRLSVPLPRHYDRFDVTVRGTDWSREEPVAISEDGQASYLFR